jgi:hypothetical protein
LGRNRDVVHIHCESIVWGDNHVKMRFFVWKTQHMQDKWYSNFFIIRKSADPVLCTYTAFKVYMDFHKEHYKVLECESVWLDCRGKSTIKLATLANCTRNLMLKAGHQEEMFLK